MIVRYTSLTKHAVFVLPVLFINTLFGVSRLLETFAGDQAMFVVYASEINNGALLYRDVWDIKQPGIFLFYLTGGKLFGFTEFGIHLFELLYWLMFSAVLLVTLRGYFRSSVFTRLTPLLTVGFYYVICGSWHLTQVEGLVGFPLYLTLWAAVKAAESQSEFKKYLLLFVSGLAGGVVLTFKLILLPIVVLFWLTLLSFLLARRGDSLQNVIFRIVPPVMLGLAIPVIVVLAYFAWHDALAVVYYTSFEYPALAVAAFAGAERLPVLKQGLRWFITAFLPLIILTFIWAIFALKSLKASGKDLSNNLTDKIRQMNLLTVNLILWIFAGIGIVWAQRLSWWEYHYLLLLVPLGILAVKGIERLWEQAARVNILFTKPSGRAVFIICIFLLFVPMLKFAAWRTKNTFISRMNLPAEILLAPSGDLDAEYEKIRRETAFLSGQNSRPGKIFVCGQPLYYYLTKRPPALASNGWMSDMFLPEQWRQLTEEISTKTPSYIVVDEFCHNIITQQSPETLQLLKDNYHLRTADNNVAWYDLASELSP